MTNSANAVMMLTYLLSFVTLMPVSIPSYAFSPARPCKIIITLIKKVYKN